MTKRKTTTEPTNETTNGTTAAHFLAKLGPAVVDDINAFITTVNNTLTTIAERHDFSPRTEAIFIACALGGALASLTAKAEATNGPEAAEFLFTLAGTVAADLMNSNLLAEHDPDAELTEPTVAYAGNA